MTALSPAISMPRTPSASTRVPSVSNTSRWRATVSISCEDWTKSRSGRSRSTTAASPGMYSGEAPGGTRLKPSHMNLPTASGRMSTPWMWISRSPFALSCPISVLAPGQPAAVRTILSGDRVMRTPDWSRRRGALGIQR